MTSPTRVLCVDDEPRVLEGLDLQLGWDYEVHTAGSGEAGLRVLDEHGPFAVVISDMRMPQMDGAAFLAQVRQHDRDATRILLTGFADTTSAVEAVNKGQIFHFLQKPCGREDLLSAVAAAAERHRLVTAERSLLENTLQGSIELLTNVLSLTAPLAFSRASHIKAYVKHVTQQLNIEDAWQYEVAAMLSQLGCITIPPETLQRVFAGQNVSEPERSMLDAHPGIGRDLVAHIPRLELCAEMIAAQHDDSSNVVARPTTDEERIAFGGALLRTANALDAGLMLGQTKSETLTKLRKTHRYPTWIIDALDDFQVDRSEEVVRAVRALELQPFMVLDEDVLTNSGSVVVPKGRELDRALLERLKNFASGVGLREPIRVRVRGDVADRCGIAS